MSPGYRVSTSPTIWQTCRVFDATPLIYLATVDHLEIAAHVEGPCHIPEEVYEEVVTAGIEHSHADARRIDHRVENGVFSVTEVDESSLAPQLRTNPTLSEADVSVLACAASIDGIAVMDEAAGRRVAAVEEIETRVTASLVLRCVKTGHLSVPEARETIDAIIEAGWYCTPDLYAQIVRKLESLAD